MLSGIIGLKRLPEEQDVDMKQAESRAKAAAEAPFSVKTVSTEPGIHLSCGSTH